ncbi:MAG: penicillin acylase family protein, partial [Phycisphaeraceae bacterium]|nr:penicillin acylase family protein [Phycisphaeraceae bacterium]
MKQEINCMPHTLLILLMLVAMAGNVGAESFAATIVRDNFGVPYIFAESIADAAFGDGYAQAQDRLGLVMDNILTATGTRAARLGAREVERDYRARVTGARHTAYAQWETLPRDVQRVFTGFAAGINRYMEDATLPLPALARPVEPQEILASMLFGGLYRQLNQAQKDLQGLGANPIAGEGSNGAVLGPARSASGK